MLRTALSVLFLCATSSGYLAQTTLINSKSALNNTARYVMVQHTGSESPSLPVYYLVEKPDGQPFYAVPGIEVETLSRMGLDSAMTLLSGWLVNAATAKVCHCGYSGKFGSFKIALKNGGALKEYYLDCLPCSDYFIAHVLSATASKNQVHTRILNKIATAYHFYTSVKRR